MTSCYTENRELDYQLFIRRIKERIGVDLGAYKRPQMERRLWCLVEQAGARSFNEYFTLLMRDKALLANFCKRVTINVSEMFRDPQQFQKLARDILPQIMPSGANIKIWSAGCSYGAEAYSLAILAKEILKPDQQVRVLGTDIDEEMLTRAREGLFNDEEMRNVSILRKRSFFVKESERWRVKAELRLSMKFQRHDLLCDSFDKSFHLIACRNVIIYFTEEVKENLYERFYKSLAPGGVLFVGGTERVSNAGRLGLIPRGPYFYQKHVGRHERVE